MSLLDAIADPARLQIVRRLAQDGPASLQQLADAAGVHLNTARAHVSALEHAGAVVSRPRERAGRGKQGLEYELAEGWTLGSDDFRTIAEVLASAVIRNEMSSEDLLELGRAWGRYTLGRPGAHDPEAEVVRALERLGYVATIEDNRLQLAGCPCILVAPDMPGVICDLAMGLVEGVLEASGSHLRLGERRHHHAERRCQVALASAGDSAGR
jgi:predicted ArsR family transcriptional regulator